MAELTTAAGLPLPEMEDTGGCVTVRFRHGVAPVRFAGRLQVAGKSGIQVRKLSDVQQTIFDLLNQADHPLALREIRAHLPESMSVRQVMRALARLRELGLARWRSWGQRTGRRGG